MQTRLKIESKKRRKPDDIQFNNLKDGVQRIKLSEGCPHLCPYCYEDNKLKVFPIPELKGGTIKILDMNFLWQHNIIERINQLADMRIRGQFFEAVCGFDFRFMTQEIAYALKKAKFINIRIAWDWNLNDQYKIKDVLNMFFKAGYKPNSIGIFMIVNWKIPLNVCDLKLDLLKVWNVGVCDCCFDGGYSIAIPEYWTQSQIDYFSAKCSLHNQMIRFKIYPELKRAYRFTKKSGATLKPSKRGELN